MVYILKMLHVIIIVAAGFPCQDNSTLRNQRKGLRGHKTGLFYDIANHLESLRLLHAHLKLTSPIYTLWENVRGTSEEDSQTMMELTKCFAPVLLDAEECSFSRRPRKFWPNWTVQTREWEHWTMKGPCDHLQNWASLPLAPPWEGTGFSLYGERMVTRTCPGEWSATPTFRTKGLDRADKGTILRWRQDGYRLSTFQYEAETLLWKGDEWRLPLPDELDELLGYPRGYTAVAGATDLQREQLLGNTMHVAAVVRLLEDLKDGTPVSRTDRRGRRRSRRSSAAQSGLRRHQQHSPDNVGESARGPFLRRL